MKLSSARLLAILVVVSCSLASISSGLGALELPGIDVESSSYRERVLREATEAAAPADIAKLRREAKRAQSQQRWRDAVRISERIVAADPDEFFAWIALAAAWRSVDVDAVEIAAAAFQAWTLADNEDKRTEALLLIIENLHQRQQDSLFRQALQAAGDVVSEQAIDRLLSGSLKPEADQAAPEADEESPAFALVEVTQRLDRDLETGAPYRSLVPVSPPSSPGTPTSTASTSSCGPSRTPTRLRTIGFRSRKRSCACWGFKSAPTTG